MNWSSRPMVRIFFLLLAGILLAWWVPVVRQAGELWLVVVMALLSLIAYTVYRKNRSWKWRWVNGLIFSLLILLAGIYLTVARLVEKPLIYTDKQETFVAEVVAEPAETEKSVKMILELKKTVSGDSLLLNGQRVMAFFEKDSLSRQLQYGDVLVFQGNLKQPEGPKNPGEFDYAAFLALHDIYAAVYVRQHKWNWLGSEENSLYVLATRVRHYLLKALQKNGVAGNDYAVAAAILLGYDQLMDPELQQQYATAGAMHILCVSGLHVGIIFLILDFMLGFLRRNRFQRYLKVILLLTLIWFYALLTGLSPSVMRASVMISLFIIASLFKRYNDVYNTLAASAVLLLFFNPLLIFNVGFQLSYSAVLGILKFYKPVYGMVYIKNVVADKIWSVMAVSIVAQLGTFPLAAHYFHFFPVYFWLSNIFIFPLSFAIIGGGMIFMLFSWLPVVSGVLGTILSGFVFVLNYIIGLVKYLPYNGIDDLYFPWPKVVLSYALILMLIPLLLKRMIKLTIPVLSVVLLLLLFNTWHKYSVFSQNRMVFYSIPGHHAYDFIRGKEHLLVVDSALAHDQGKMDYHFQNSRIAWGLAADKVSEDDVVENRMLQLYYNGSFGMFGPYRFFVPGGRRYYKSGSVIEVDFVIISGKKKQNLQELLDIIKFDSLIIDSSVPYWKQKRLEEQAAELKVRYYNVNRQGAFLVEM
jgi:competence protein ComEC